ncbi:TMV resistance protein N-like [Prosopis cineraria]|uniref:TMV resistance protein N-like n=1 Tax=Prosopis cineraria TaxID=364024 RepID=UPI00240F9606|nr:TMV resistance protein N-like [Prosopis cineraria]
MNSLIELDLYWCRKLSVLPEFGECMKKLSVLDARKTSITRLPESFRFLTGLGDLNLRGCRYLVLQMSGFNLTSLTGLDLSHCGINEGSIPEDLGGLSSLITLRLEGNGFANLPTGCFSNLFQLLHLYLNNCKRLKSLPKLPPRLMHLYATGCASMEPLSYDAMWNLVSSLDHEYRLQTNYEKRVVQPIQSAYVPEVDFLATIPRFEIPSWFPNQVPISTSEGAAEYVFVVDIPPNFRASKWSGLAVCLEIRAIGMTFDKLVISWSCRAPQDYYICKEWANDISLDFAWRPRLFIMLLDFNDKTC